MEKLINSAFDFFAYALPGTFIILSLLILEERNETVQDYLNFAQDLKAGGVAVLLAAGYVTGFAITPLGRKLYRRYQRGLFFRKMNLWLEGNLEKIIYEFNDRSKPEQYIPISKRFVLVRELTPLSFRYIESWHVYSLMSHNMAVANCLVIVFVSIRLAFYRPDNPWTWALIMLGALFFCLMFLYSAAKFNVWSMNEQNAAIEAFNLSEHAQKLAEQENQKEPARQP